MTPDQALRAAAALLRQTLRIVGLIIAGLAALRLFGITAFPLLPRVDLLQAAAVAAACIYAGKD